MSQRSRSARRHPRFSQPWVESDAASRGSRRHRAGMALILVLAVIAFTFAIGFAMLRTQTTSLVLENNSGQRIDARQAAIAGLSMALHKMTTSSWGGVDSVLTGQLSPSESYEVTFATGDASLAQGDPNYAEYPYRVTLVSTGYAADPASTGHLATYRVRAVVQLIRRRLSTAPNSWSDTQSFTVYQWGNTPANIEVPSRIEGPALFQGPLQLCPTYPYDSRPFSGTIDEVAVYRETVSSSEIQNIYDARTRTDNTDRVAAWYSFANPWSFWRLNEPVGSTVAIDQRNRNPGAYFGPLLGVAGSPTTPAQTAAWFDGANDYVSLGTMDAGGSSNFSILAWIKPDTTDQDFARILCKANGETDDDTYWDLSVVKQSSSLRLRFRLKSLGNTTNLTASSGNITPGNWTFAAATYDGWTMKLYKDASLVASTLKLGSVNNSSSVRTYIGDCPPGSTRARYLRDLEKMRAAGMTDMRPLTGPVSLGSGRTTTANSSLLKTELNITPTNVTASDSAPMTAPGTVTSYQLYSGGKSYSIPVVSSTLANVSLAADPINNPLGVFYSPASVALYDNVNIQGTLIVTGSGNSADLTLVGENVQLSPATLPTLDGSTQVHRLPTMIVGNNFSVSSGAGGTISGMVTAWNRYNVASSYTGGTALAHDGRIVCRDLQIGGRSQWIRDFSWWQNRLNHFLDVFNAAGVANVQYFPEYLRAWGLAPEPSVTIKPQDSAISYHWHNWNNPLFVPHPNDGGLRWDLVDWQDNP